MQRGLDALNEEWMAEFYPNRTNIRVSAVYPGKIEDINKKTFLSEGCDGEGNQAGAAHVQRRHACLIAPGSAHEQLHS